MQLTKINNAKRVEALKLHLKSTSPELYIGNIIDELCIADEPKAGNYLFLVKNGNTAKIFIGNKNVCKDALFYNLIKQSSRHQVVLALILFDLATVLKVWDRENEDVEKTLLWILSEH